MRSAELHIAIFSEKYAESPWCLAELLFMLKTGTPIVPVFYYVDPADLRWVDKGKGGYAPSFLEHEEKGRYTPEMLQEWKTALYEASFYRGHIITNKEHSLGSGSLIIVTTRELEVLRCWGISSIYKMRTLDLFHAKQLFCWHAFLQPSPLYGFEELVKKFLDACNGLPLSLKVFGGQLYGKYCKDYWECQLDKIYRVLHKDIKETLKISYDVLDDEEKEVFLDVVCFFIGEKISLAIEVWNGSGWTGLHSWEKLMNKCLVELDEQNCIRMHDHLRDLGREIASKHSSHRLWRPEQITDFQNEPEKRSIRGIMIVTAGSTREVYDGLCGLAASSLGLKIFDVRGDYVSHIIDKLVSKELVWLRCNDFAGHGNLPSQLSLKKLRVLEFRSFGHGHQLGELWEVDSDGSLCKLKTMWLYRTRVSKISISEDCCPTLETLNIGDNDNLTEIEVVPMTVKNIRLENCKTVNNIRGIGGLVNLEDLRILNCPELQELPSFAELTSLRKFELAACYKIVKLEGLEHCRSLEQLRAEIRWEIPGLQNLEHMERLRTVELKTNNISAVEPCIRALKEWPGEIIVCTRSGPDAASQLVSAFTFPNLSIVDSVENIKINCNQYAELFQKRPSNVGAIMVCFVISCEFLILETEFEIEISSEGCDTIDRTIVGGKEGKWVWIGGEEKNLMEALCQLLAILGR
ncbi:hypothetical protein KI387_040493 [Taxus chinensis]|uniref:TIR domain-containing protein n=1 Tax=Taxus chinensis TaxID=29808 RepID=A0AA38C5E6_TAXCH|nr:hypothetical protein KI387_040493 [Taxus chinensis]